MRSHQHTINTLFLFPILNVCWLRMCLEPSSVPISMGSRGECLNLLANPIKKRKIKQLERSSVIRVTGVTGLFFLVRKSNIPTWRFKYNESNDDCQHRYNRKNNVLFFLHYINKLLLMLPWLVINGNL